MKVNATRNRLDVFIGEGRHLCFSLFGRVFVEFVKFGSLRHHYHQPSLAPFVQRCLNVGDLANKDEFTALYEKIRVA